MIDPAESYTPLVSSGKFQSKLRSIALCTSQRDDAVYIVPSHGFYSLDAIDKDGNVNWALDVFSHLRLVISHY